MAKKPVFAPLPPRALADKELSRIDLAVLGVVAAHDRFSQSRGAGAGCYLENKDIAAIIGADPRNVSRAKSNLENRGYLVASQMEDDRRRKSARVVYLVDEDVEALKKRASRERKIGDENNTYLPNKQGDGNNTQSTITGDISNTHQAEIGVEDDRVSDVKQTRNPLLRDYVKHNRFSETEINPVETARFAPVEDGFSDLFENLFGNGAGFSGQSTVQAIEHEPEVMQSPDLFQSGAVPDGLGRVEHDPADIALRDELSTFERSFTRTREMDLDACRIRLEAIVADGTVQSSTRSRANNLLQQVNHRQAQIALAEKQKNRPKTITDEQVDTATRADLSGLLAANDDMMPAIAKRAKMPEQALSNFAAGGPITSSQRVRLRLALSEILMAKNGY
jgi:DNA-binding MarR family transcriptional regulator